MEILHAARFLGQCCYPAAADAAQQSDGLHYTWRKELGKCKNVHVGYKGHERISMFL